MMSPSGDDDRKAWADGAADRRTFLETLKAYRFKGRTAARKILTFSETLAELERLGLFSKS